MFWPNIFLSLRGLSRVQARELDEAISKHTKRSRTSQRKDIYGPKFVSYTELIELYWLTTV